MPASDRLRDLLYRRRSPGLHLIRFGLIWLIIMLISMPIIGVSGGNVIPALAAAVLILLGCLLLLLMT